MTCQAHTPKASAATARRAEGFMKSTPVGSNDCLPAASSLNEQVGLLASNLHFPSGGTCYFAPNNCSPSPSRGPRWLTTTSLWRVQTSTSPGQRLPDPCSPGESVSLAGGQGSPGLPSHRALAGCLCFLAEGPRLWPVRHWRARLRCGRLPLVGTRCKAGTGALTSDLPMARRGAKYGTQGLLPVRTAAASF